jgi:hypothetical protein
MPGGQAEPWLPLTPERYFRRSMVTVDAADVRFQPDMRRVK